MVCLAIWLVEHTHTTFNGHMFMFLLCANGPTHAVWTVRPPFHHRSFKLIYAVFIISAICVDILFARSVLCANANWYVSPQSSSPQNSLHSAFVCVENIYKIIIYSGCLKYCGSSKQKLFGVFVSIFIQAKSYVLITPNKWL